MGLGLQDTAAVCAVLEKMAGVKRGRKAAQEALNVVCARMSSEDRAQASGGSA